MTTFGVELEHASPLDRDQMSALIANSGVDTVPASYLGRDYTRWQCKTDVTIPTSQTARHQLELVSRVMTWGNGQDIADLKTVCDLASEAGGKIYRPRGDRSAGLHVHIQMSDLTRQQLAQWARIWQGQQATTDSLVRSGRHSGGPNAHWCRTLSDRMWDAFRSAAGAGDARSLAGAANGHHLAVNTQWYAERGTIEIRQRDGSLNFKKIMGWVAYIIATKEHARSGMEFTGGMDYLEWLEQQGFITADHRAWAERRDCDGPAPATTHAHTVRSAAQDRFANMRRLQNI